MAHKKKDLPKHLEGYDLAITGHTHKYDHREVKGVVYFNPGSCGPRRVGQEITLAVMRISDGRIAGIEKIIIPHEDGRCPELTGAAHAVDKIQIEKVIRLIQRRKSAVEIARQLQLDERITEQVVRLDLTHPGVDAEGIMAKMGL